jgi:hypothetical protein
MRRAASQIGPSSEAESCRSAPASKGGREPSVVAPTAVAGRDQALRLNPVNIAVRRAEMSNTELTDQQLLNEAQAAFREGSKERAKPFLAEFSRRSEARDKAKAANDPT